MKQLSKSFYNYFILLLFFVLNAGFFSIIPISGIGFATYMFLFVNLLFLCFQTGFKIKKYVIIFCFAFIWLFILLLIKKRGTYYGLYSWFLGGLIFFSYNYLDEESKGFKELLVLSLLFALFFSYIEVFSGFHFPSSRFIINKDYSKTWLGVDIPAYYFTNENDFSAMLVTTFFLLRSICKKEKIIYDVIILPLVFIILYLAGARLCMIAVFTYYFYLGLKRISKKKRIVIIGALLIIFLYFVLHKILPRIISLRNDSSTMSSIVRINLLLVALRTIFVEKQLFGLGPAAFPSIITENSGTASVIDPHNWFMELGVEAGLIFLLLYCFFIFHYMKKEQDNTYKAMFLVFLICNFCSSRFSKILWNWFFLSFFIKRFYTINLTYTRCRK